MKIRRMTRVWALLLGGLLAGAGMPALAGAPEELRQRAAQGDSGAALALARHFLARGDAGQRDEAARWLRAAVLKGSPPVQAAALEVLEQMRVDLAQEVVAKYNIELDPAIPSAGAALFATRHTDEAIALLIREAWLLNGAAAKYLEVLYEEEFEDFSAHDPRILAFFRSAAREDIPSARVFLGRIYLYGLGIPADVEAGKQLLATAGDPHGHMELAQYALALEDEAQAARHWLNAAEQYDFAPAWYNLGIRARHEGSHRVALDYFERALAQDPDHFGARLELARLLGKGQDVAADPERAMRLLNSVIREAEGQVRLIALANLGLFYMEGVNVVPDPKRALALFREAAAGGLDSVRPYIAQLEGRTQEQP